MIPLNQTWFNAFSCVVATIQIVHDNQLSPKPVQETPTRVVYKINTDEVEVIRTMMETGWQLLFGSPLSPAYNPELAPLYRNGSRPSTFEPYRNNPEFEPRMRHALEQYFTLYCIMY